MRSLERWEDNPAGKGEVNRSVLRGRPRILDPAVMEILLALIEESPILDLDEIVDYLAVIHDVHILRTTLRNRGDESESTVTQRTLVFVISVSQ